MMCLEKKEKNWFGAGYLGLMVVILGFGASDIRRNAIVDTRLSYIESSISREDKLTKADGKIMNNRMDQMVSLIESFKELHKEQNKMLQTIVLNEQTHSHDGQGRVRLRNGWDQAIP